MPLIILRESGSIYPPFVHDWGELSKNKWVKHTLWWTYFDSLGILWGRQCVDVILQLDHLFNHRHDARVNLVTWTIQFGSGARLRHNKTLLQCPCPNVITKLHFSSKNTILLLYPTKHQFCQRVGVRLSVYYLGDSSGHWGFLWWTWHRQKKRHIMLYIHTLSVYTSNVNIMSLYKLENIY